MMYNLPPGFLDLAYVYVPQMKKRAQYPDGHTFTILLRGLAWHTKYPTSLQRALSLYHSMYAENSPVKPTIIHTNAVLKVCARAKDLDSLWGVAARMPKTGRNAPDAATFTTILNALCRIAKDTAQETDQSDSRSAAQEDNADLFQRAVLQGRRMWAEITDRWRSGEIRLDEDLVCSMGRLLVLSEAPRDLDDVLSLIEQTMGIPRQADRAYPGRMPPSTPAGRALLSRSPQQPSFSGEDRSLDVASAPESSLTPQELLSTSDEESTDIVPSSHSTDQPFASAGDDFVPGQEFNPISASTHMAGYVVPSHSTLSLVVGACTRLHNIPAAQNYWGLLTSVPYSISPDTENYHTYLRLLRVQRASRLCVELVQEMRDGLGIGAPVEHSERRGVKGEEGGVQAKTFRIAMNTCVRDINNPNVLQHASKLCRMMVDCLPSPDMRAFSMFLDIGLKTAAVKNDWRLLSSVLRGTEIGIRGLRNHLHWEEWTKSKKTYDYKEVLEGDLRVFLRKLIGAYDYLINGSGHEMMQEELRKCKEQRNIIGAWDTRLGRLEGNVRGRKPSWAGDREREQERGEIDVRGRGTDRRRLLGRRDEGQEGETGRQTGKRIHDEDVDEDVEVKIHTEPEDDNIRPRANTNWTHHPERPAQRSSWGRAPTFADLGSEPRTAPFGKSSGGQWKRMMRANAARAKIEQEW
jgi:hypothetical protein